MTTERDLRNQMAYARQEAIQEGLAEGRAVGRAEGAANALIEVAGKMLVSGEPIEKIMAFTGLSTEIIEGLKNR